jgi:putative phosphoesterase
MRVGIFSDSHDHLDNIRRVVDLFNRLDCEVVLFAGDLVSTFAVPPLRKLRAKILGCYGDNEGNKPGLQAGFSILGKLQEAPALYTLDDGTRVVIVHMQRQLKDFADPFDIAIVGHTHRPDVHTDDQGRLWINPGETSGWTYGQPTVALLETTTRSVEIIPVPVDQPLPSWDSDRRSRTPRSLPANPETL